jgi:hypothetical protein
VPVQYSGATSMLSSRRLFRHIPAHVFRDGRVRNTPKFADMRQPLFKQNDAEISIHGGASSSSAMLVIQVALS